MKEDIKRAVLNQIREEEILSLANSLIKIPSLTSEETEVARFLGKFMKENGLDVEFQEVEPGRFQVIGKIRGRGEGKSLMFNGHLDTDPILSGWNQDPWTPVLKERLLYGAGAFNMKAGVAAMTMAAIALVKAKTELKGSLTVAAVVGELQGGVGTVYLLNHGLKPDMAILPEPYGVYNITTKHGGMCEMAIHVFGRSRHISLVEQGIDAIEKMTAVTKALRKMEFTHEPDPELPGLPRIVIGSIIGGRGEEHELRGPSFLSDHCTIFIDIRFAKGTSPESIKKDIERGLSRLAMEDPDLKFEIEFPPNPKYRIARIPMYPIDVPREEYIVQALKKCFLEVTGQEPRQIGTPTPVYKAYTGVDSGHFWQRGIPCCIFGPMGDWENSQYTDVDEMILCSKVMALTALEVCGLH